MTNTIDEKYKKEIVNKTGEKEIVDKTGETIKQAKESLKETLSSKVFFGEDFIIIKTGPENTLDSTDINKIKKKLLEDFKIEKKIINKLIHILIELSDNIWRYSIPGTENYLELKIEKEEGVIKGITITSSNWAKDKYLKKAINYVKSLNYLSYEKLKEKHLNTIQNKKINEEGGAGLGLITILKKVIKLGGEIKVLVEESDDDNNGYKKLKIIIHIPYTQKKHK